MSVVAPKFLFHGSASVFHRPDVRKGRGYKDFGKGFYMSVDSAQAVGMMHKKFTEVNSMRAFIDLPKPTESLYRIALDQSYLNTLRVKVFDTADEDWLDFVLACRRTEAGVHAYDVVVGPTADDDTRLLIKNFLDGVYGDPVERAAKETLLRLLKPERLGLQWFVRDQGVADRLIRKFERVDWRDFQ